MYLTNDTFLQGGKYKIVRFINAGGFGNTYEGLHVMLNKKVAIKEFFVKDFCNRDEKTATVTVGITSKTALVSKLKKKFIDEARAVSTLKHLHIVNVYDVFEENGTAYYVMEFIEGSSLNDIVKTQGAMSEEKATHYILQVADALRYVHSRNRLHLDIKPGNIMIDKENEATLIDFGASKQYDEEAGENTSTLLGKTPGYAPLEQMGNDVVKFTPSTDIYALGATFYKLITGNTPPSAMLLASGSETIALPSGISGPISDTILQAMQTNKKARPQSIEEFLNLLKPSIPELPRDPEGNDAGQKEQMPTTSVPTGNKGGLVAVCCALAIAVVCALGYIIYTKSTYQPKEPEVVTTVQTVTGQTYQDASGQTFSYTGEVENDMPNGKGTGIYPYGNYTGEYKDGLRHGQGQFESKDGSNKYEGTFNSDKYEIGKLITSDGYYFEGKFKDGQPYSGNWYDKAGKVYQKVGKN